MSEIFRLPSEFSPDTAKNFIKVAEGLKTSGLSMYSGSLDHWLRTHSRRKRGDRITEEEAERILDKDLKECHRAVCRRVKQCTEGQYIALMSFVFNFGANSFSSSTLLKLHNAEVYEAAADQFERWIYSTDPKTGKKGPDSRLIPRRREEKKQYLRGLV